VFPFVVNPVLAEHGEGPSGCQKKIIINFAFCPIFCIFAIESGDDAHAWQI
jgi:hypothetical protein